MFHNFDRLAWQIVLLLLDDRAMTTAQIDRHISLESEQSYSSATLYRRIASLQKMQVLFISRRKVFLNLAWLEQVTQLLARFGNIEMALKNVALLIPRREGEQRQFTARSLFDLDPIWNSLLIEIGSRPDERELCGYNARAWYPLGLLESEHALYHSLSSRNIATCLYMGTKSVIEFQSADNLNVPGLQLVQCHRSPFTGEDYISWASTHYLLECRLPAAIVAEFSRVLKESRNLESETPGRMNEAFRQPVSCTLKIVKSARRAREFREYLSSYQATSH